MKTVLELSKKKKKKVHPAHPEDRSRIRTLSGCSTFARTKNSVAMKRNKASDSLDLPLPLPSNFAILLLVFVSLHRRPVAIDSTD